MYETSSSSWLQCPSRKTNTVPGVKQSPKPFQIIWKRTTTKNFLNYTKPCNFSFWHHALHIKNPQVTWIHRSKILRNDPHSSLRQRALKAEVTASKLRLPGLYPFPSPWQTPYCPGPSAAHRAAVFGSCGSFRGRQKMCQSTTFAKVVLLGFFQLDLIIRSPFSIYVNGLAEVVKQGAWPSVKTVSKA